MTDTLTPVEETTTDAPSASEESKVQRERRLHGPESAAQLIGHLGGDATYAAPRQREDGTSTHGYIWGTMAVNRGENFDPSWVFYNIYPVAPENGERPDAEAMQALAAQLTKGQRVRMQGPIEVRQGATHEVEINGEKRNIRDTSVTVKLFWDGSSVPFDEKGARPITLLPRIGEEKQGPDLGF